MQDQQSERQRARRFVETSASLEVTPSHEPTTMSSSTPRYKRKGDYAYYKGILVIAQCRLLSLIWTHWSKTSAR